MLESIAMGVIGAAFGQTKVGRATGNLGLACARLGVAAATAPINAAIDHMTVPAPRQSYSEAELDRRIYTRNGFTLWKGVDGNEQHMAYLNEYEAVARAQLKAHGSIDAAFDQFGTIQEGEHRLHVNKQDGYMPTMTLFVRPGTDAMHIRAYKARAIGLRLIYPKGWKGTYSLDSHNRSEANMFAAIMMIPQIRDLHRTMRGIPSEAAAIEHASRRLGTPVPLVRMRLTPPTYFGRY